jgi:hypothetical protein
VISDPVWDDDYREVRTVLPEGSDKARQIPVRRLGSGERLATPAAPRLRGPRAGPSTPPGGIRGPA